MQHQHIPIIIPAYEPDIHLLTLIKNLQATGAPLIVVNDGSNPQYDAIFQAGKAQGAIVLEHTSNLGKGQALKTAFAYVLAQMPDCVGVVTADADGQHLPVDIAAVAHHLEQHPHHLILGARHFTGPVPLRSKFGNTLTRSVFAAFIGKKITDTQTGLRGIPRSLMQELLKIRSCGYEFELEMLIYAVEHHIAISEVPIATVYENNNACSHFNPLLDSFKIYFVFLRFAGLGLITALVDLLVFVLCFNVTHTIFLSECFARGSGGLFSFMTGKHMVFKSNGKHAVELLKFMTLWLTLLFISYAMIRGAYFLGFNIYLSKILTQALLFFASFSIQRFVVFPHKPQPAPIK